MTDRRITSSKVRNTHDHPIRRDVVVVGAGKPASRSATSSALIRMVVVPAAMTLLGKWNWYLPHGSTGCQNSTSRATPARSTRRRRPCLPVRPCRVGSHLVTKGTP